MTSPRRPPQSLPPIRKGPPSVSPKGKPLAIETEHFWLRSIGPEAAGAKLHEWLTDQDVLEGINLPKVDWSLERLRHFLAAYDNRARYAVGIFRKAPAAMVGFYTVDVNLQHKRAMLSAVMVDKECRGSDIVFETTRALNFHLFDHRDVDKISVGVLETNRRMLFHMMRAVQLPGARELRFEARLQSEVLRPDGRRSDLLIFAAHKG